MGRLPDPTAIDPTATMATVTVRMPAAHKEELAALATRKRMQTGALVQMADLIREAIAEYLEQHRDKEDQKTTEL